MLTFGEDSLLLTLKQQNWGINPTQFEYHEDASLSHWIIEATIIMGYGWSEYGGFWTRQNGDLVIMLLYINGVFLQDIMINTMICKLFCKRILYVEDFVTYILVRYSSAMGAMLCISSNLIWVCPEIDISMGTWWQNGISEKQFCNTPNIVRSPYSQRFEM